MKQLLLNLWQDESGQDLAEYTMLLVLIAVVALAAVGTLGGNINGELDNAGQNLFVAP
jgi:Flp pilus assembly pilin Flp